MNILDNALIGRQISTPNMSEAVSLIPYELMCDIRTYHLNTPRGIVFEALDHMGIDAIADLISQGAFTTDIADSLDVPVILIDEWFKQDEKRIDMRDLAEKYAAESHLSVAHKKMMGVGNTDVDGLKVAKEQANFLKWIASRKDKEKYGDQVKRDDKIEAPIVFNIVMAGAHPLPDLAKVIDIPEVNNNHD